MPPPDNPPAPPFVLYVSAVEGNPVTRFALSGRRSSTEFGVSLVNGKRVYDTRAVIALPVAEVEKFGREYERAITDGSLVRRTAEDFAAWRAERALAAKEASGKAAEEQRAEPSAQQQPATPAGGSAP